MTTFLIILVELVVSYFGFCYVVQKTGNYEEGFAPIFAWLCIGVIIMTLIWRLL